MARDGSRMVSTPSKAIEPRRFCRMPMIDLRVVVLPAPLRPSKVTTSPGATSKVTPCKTWDSPYHASRLRTASSGAVEGAGVDRAARAGSAMHASNIGLDPPRVLGDGRVVALGEHATARQHRDPVRQGSDHR